MKKLFVAFSHTLTDSQIEDFFKMVCNEPFSTFRVNNSDNWVAINGDMKEIGEIVSLSSVSAELQARMSAIPASATLSEIKELAKSIVAEAVKAGATHFYCAGEPALAMWANLYASGKLFNEMLAGALLAPSDSIPEEDSKGMHTGVYYKKMVCIQSTTERCSVEVKNGDGTVTKTQTFQHVQWRGMF